MATVIQAHMEELLGGIEVQWRTENIYLLLQKCLADIVQEINVLIYIELRSFMGVEW